MTLSHGFQLIREQFIDELRTHARFFVHAGTGAQLLSLSNEDENKVFGITFRTPPSDSTGVAHILEHSVLCGSRKYPVKEPFVELLKGSLKTFLNAFTYPDKTCYPVASLNLQDFYNLIDVYLDAVFYPRLTPHILQQEGWHLDLERKEEPIIYKGVVYNEMKGAYSSPDNVLAERSQQSLFPENTYGLDSGGDPREIPSLTFEQFKSFHQKYYHPSNARIYFYGDDPPEERLRILNEYLKDFNRMDADSAIHLQPPFEAPRRIVRSFAVRGNQPESEGSAKGMITINWLLPETTDPEKKLSLQLLQYILLGMPGSPLRKALIDSRFGDDLAGVGLETDLRQMYFSTGLKGINIEKADRIETLILETLSQLVASGIDRQFIEAALNTIEFRMREENTGNFPRGLALMLRALTAWLHGGDPVAMIAFETPLSAIKRSLDSDLRFFERLIDQYFLKNPHRTTLLLKPDPALEEAEREDERKRLESIRQGMDSEALDELVRNTHRLKELQELPDPPEALAAIPSLRLSDLDRKNKIIPIREESLHKTRVLYHDLFTNGIVYLDIGFNLAALPQEYLPYVHLLGRSLVEIGTEKEDFVTLSQRISRRTGGIRPDCFTSAVSGSEDIAAWLFLRGKAMVSQTHELLGIIRDLLLSIKLDNRERFRQMVLEERARQEQRIVPSGHQMINTRLRSHFGKADWAMEQMSGFSHLFFIRELASRVDDDWPVILSVLETIRGLLVNRANMIVNVTLDQPNWSLLDSHLSPFLESLPVITPARLTPTRWNPELPPDNEALTVPTQINFVGKGANLYQLGYRFHGSSRVITGYLRNSWLWESIRVRGGAYGAFCQFDRLSGALTFVSYRDPNTLKTLENFDMSADFLRHTDLSEDEIRKAIIGAIGNLDTYHLPDAKGYLSMLRHLTHDTEDKRQEMREEILSTTSRDFREFAEVLEGVNRSGLVKILGSQNTLAETLAGRPDWLRMTSVL